MPAVAPQQAGPPAEVEARHRLSVRLPCRWPPKWSRGWHPTAYATDDVPALRERTRRPLPLRIGEARSARHSHPSLQPEFEYVAAHSGSASGPGPRWSCRSRPLVVRPCSPERRTQCHHLRRIGPWRQFDDAGREHSGCPRFRLPCSNCRPLLMWACSSARSLRGSFLCPRTRRGAGVCGRWRQRFAPRALTLGPLVLAPGHPDFTARRDRVE